MTDNNTILGILYISTIVAIFMGALATAYATSILIEWVASKYTVYAIFSIVIAGASATDACSIISLTTEQR